MLLTKLLYIQDPSFEVRKERLVIKFRRISEKYYMVDDMETPGNYFNYKSIRYSFPTVFNVTPRKNNNPKVVRCKTCRKVFSRMATLKVHRRTHAAFTPGPYTPKDFAKRFSTGTVSREPYRPAAHLKLLEAVTPHPKEYPGYSSSPGPLPYIKPGSNLHLMDDSFRVGDMIGEGGFAKVIFNQFFSYLLCYFVHHKENHYLNVNSVKVYSAFWENGPPEEQSTVLKVQMPANDWEWYILNQVHSRFDALTHPLKEEKGAAWKGGFMSGPRCYTFRDGAVIISQLQKMGTLLDLVNLTKNADKSIIEPIAIYLTAEVLGLMELLHSINVVHADLKPDNFLVRHVPSTQSSPSLQLIDFGKAIDIVIEPGDEKKSDSVSREISKEFANKPNDTNGEASKLENGVNTNNGINATNTEVAGDSKDSPATNINLEATIVNGSGDVTAGKVDVEGVKAENGTKDDVASKPDAGNRTEEKAGEDGGRTGKYHLDYFGIAGKAIILREAAKKVLF